MGGAVNFPEMYVENVWGTPDSGDDYRASFKSDVRTLFVSGTMDSNTPPAQAEEVRRKFSNSAHLIVEYAGHEDSLPDEKVQTIIIDFLNGKDVSGESVQLPRPKFKPIP